MKYFVKYSYISGNQTINKSAIVEPNTPTIANFETEIETLEGGAIPSLVIELIRKTGSDRPYLVYTAYLEQGGGDAPTATILENTIGTIVFTRSSAGVYRATLAGAFTASKTVAYCQAFTAEGLVSIDMNGASTDEIIFRSHDSTWMTADDIIRGMFFEIRVYG